jgi:putative SOS response-associated peptidase YedK
MCGRYYIDEETAEELQKIVVNIDKKINPGKYLGDIVPSVSAPVITNQGNELTLDELSWGFKNSYKNSLIINARAETVSEKRTFRDCLALRRCIIPAKGFYEWDRSKNKFTFTHRNKSIMLMAGLYNEENKFVIITTKGNPSMEKIHDRMPLVLTSESIRTWLFNEEKSKDILNKTPPLLDHKSDMEQMRLEF